MSKHSLDISGAICDFIATVLYAKASIYAWPIGIISIFVNGWLYFKGGLYGDMTIQAVYLVSSLYGWYEWLYGGKEHHELTVSYITFKHAALLTLIGACGFVASVFLLTHYTHSQVPYWDAATAVLSLLAQWLMCRKIIETWIVWFVVDAMYVFLYFYKNMPAHSIILFIYLGLAIVGYVRWFTIASVNRSLPAKSKCV